MGGTGGGAALTVVWLSVAGGQMPSGNPGYRSAGLQLASSGPLVHGGPLGEALRPRAVGDPPAFDLGQRRGSVVAVLSGVTGATPPLQLRHRLVPHLVLGLVTGPVPAGDKFTITGMEAVTMVIRTRQAVGKETG